MKRQTKGFTLIELVIVIVILGLLAATAIPRFINITEDAQNASLEGVTGGLATAVSFSRSQWEVDGRRNSSVLLDGTTVQIDTRFGYPTGTSNNDASLMTASTCSEVFNSVLQSAPTNVLSTSDARDKRYVVDVVASAGGNVTDIDGNVVNGLPLCVYYQVAALALDVDSGIPTPVPNLTTAGAKYITYNPGTGQVLSYFND